MAQIPMWRRYLRFLGPDVREDVEEELAFHLEMLTDELIEAGLPPEEARTEALRHFGDLRRIRQELLAIGERHERVRRWGGRVEMVAASARFALRRMRRSPGFTLAVVLTFALGIGANATMYGVLDRLLLSPPAHVAHQDRVIRIMLDRYDRLTRARGTGDAVTYADYEAFSRAGSFAGVAAFTSSPESRIVVGRGAEARQLGSSLVSGTFFSVLGVHPEAGRFFGPDEDEIGAEQVAVISYGAWRRAFGGDPEILGKALDFGHGPYTIIGVAPKGFTGVDLLPVDVWLPLHTAGAQLNPYCLQTPRNCSWLRAVARLAPGMTPAAAEAEATALYRAGGADSRGPGRFDASTEVVAAPLIAARGPGASSESRVALWLAGISLVVLLIACANVANLLLLRAVRQGREIGIRMALGSSRARVVGQVLTESLLLALAGGGAALLLAWWGGAFLRSRLLPEVSWEGAGVDGRLVAIVTLLALCAGAFAGLVPAVQASRPDVVEALKAGSRSATPPVSRMRSALTVAQAALSVLLLVAGGLFVRSLQRVNDLDLGLDPDGVLLVSPDFVPSTPEERQQGFYPAATDRLTSLRGVEAVSADVSTPFVHEMAVGLRVPGVDSIPRLPSGPPVLHAVSPAYFEVLDLAITRGRPLGPSDRRGAARVAVVNETMARLLWPRQDPLGKCLVIVDGPAASAPPCAEVVGVVEDARRFDLVEDAAMQYYVPLEQKIVQIPPSDLLVRVRGEPARMVPAIQAALLSLEPGLRYAHVRPLRELIDPRSRSWRLGAAVLGLFGLLALLVAGVGLYSVLAFGVAQRRFELGIRAALGAAPERLKGMVFGEALRLVMIGAALGVGVAIAVSGKISPLLFQVSPRDPLVLGGVVLVLLLTAVVAAWVPAWRATRVDPATVLRAE